MQLGSSLQEHFNAGHETADLAEVGMLDQLTMNGQRLAIVPLHDCLHDLVKAMSDWIGQLEKKKQRPEPLIFDTFLFFNQRS